MSRARDLADRVLHNRTHEDTEGGRESLITFKGEQSGGEISTLAQIQASHDGTSDDEKADLIFKTNDGSDGVSPTERMRIDSDGNIGIGLSNPSALLHLEVADNTDFMHITATGQERWAYRVASATGADDTVAFGIDGGTQCMVWHETGVVRKPNQPSFHATLSTNQTGYDATTSSGTQDYIQYNTEVYDTGNNHSGGTFTAPVDGVYLFRADAYANVGWSQTWWLVNGARAAGTDTVYVSSTSFAHSSAILKLSENDTVRYRGYISGATNATIYAHANHTWFRGILIG